METGELGWTQDGGLLAGGKAEPKPVGAATQVGTGTGAVEGTGAVGKAAGWAKGLVDSWGTAGPAGGKMEDRGWFQGAELGAGTGAGGPRVNPPVIKKKKKKCLPCLTCLPKSSDTM